MHVRVWHVGVCVGLAAFAWMDVARAQEVYLSSTSYEVVEGTPQVTITVEVTAPVQEYGGCLVSFEDGEAEKGADYVPLGGWVDWFGGDASPKEVIVSIVDDMEIEPTETFTATISYGKVLEIGSPSAATISIQDDDGGGEEPYAYVDMTGATQNRSEEWVVFAPAGEAFEVTVRYTEIPQSPVAVDWESDVAPYSGTVVFDGSDEETVTLQLDSPRGAGAMELAEFRLIQEAGRSPRARGFDPRVFEVFVAEGGLTGTNCWACVFYLFTNLADFGPCPIKCILIDVCEPGFPRGAGRTSAAHSRPPRAGDEVIPLRTELLRRYRDEVLTSSETGQYYVSEYESHSTDAVWATLRRPLLVFRIAEAIEAWIPALEDLLDGTGASVVVSQEMVDRLNVVLDAFEAVGSPSFATKIANERDKLQVDAMVGLTAAEVQQQIETLGGETPTETISWGALKSRFQ